MFEWFFFRTRFGDWLLERFELSTGLALVPLDWLGDEQIGLVVPETRPDQVADNDGSLPTVTSIPDGARADKVGA